MSATPKDVANLIAALLNQHRNDPSLCERYRDDQNAETVKVKLDGTTFRISVRKMQSTH